MHTTYNLIRLLRLPLHPRLIEALGYTGNKMYVGFYYDPAHTGSRVIAYDGKDKHCDLNHAIWKQYVQHPSVNVQLSHFNIGELGQPEHILILSNKENQAYVGCVDDATGFLISDLNSDNLSLSAGDDSEMVNEAFTNHLVNTSNADFTIQNWLNCSF